MSTQQIIAVDTKTLLALLNLEGDTGLDLLLR